MIELARSLTATAAEFDKQARRSRGRSVSHYGMALDRQYEMGAHDCRMLAWRLNHLIITESGL